MRFLFLTLASLFFLFAFTGCGKQEATPPSVPILGPTTAITVSGDSMEVTTGGIVLNTGGKTVTKRGMCFDTTRNPTINDYMGITENGSGLDAFSALFTLPLPNTTYYLRSYATNEIGTGYGNEIRYKTPGIPPVVPVLTSTTIAYGITTSSAISGGMVSSDGGASVTERGVCWSTNSNATIAGNKTVDGTGIGLFQSNLTGLLPRTLYYYRSYATNRAGTGYGVLRSFTSAGNLPVLSATTAVGNITMTSATSGGTISSDGGLPILERGVCWSMFPNPTIFNVKSSDGVGAGTFASLLTGLGEGKTYYVRAYATNSAGTGYGPQEVFNTIESTQVTDIDGNSYGIVKIAGMRWINQNLKVSRYNNGDPIQTGLSNNLWNTTTAGAYSIYDNNSMNNDIYGKLYNWYAVTDTRNLCPVGWHVPTDAEWTVMENALGGKNVAGTKLKAVSSLWTNAATLANNTSGFTGFPGGFRSNLGNYGSEGLEGRWWTSSQSTSSSSSGIHRKLVYNNAASISASDSKRSGYSVRCIRD